MRLTFSPPVPSSINISQNVLELRLLQGFNYQLLLGEITKMQYLELWFLYMTPPLNLLYNLPSIIDISERVLKLKRP